ncbi:MAG: ribosome rescue GTPase HflX [Pseudomonadota bacterium]
MFFEREKGGERAVTVNVTGFSQLETPDYDEFLLLVHAAGVEGAASFECNRKYPSPAYFIGSGKLDELKKVVKENDVDVVLFNHALSPGQERNIERVLGCRVVDRTGVILDIFAQRARTYEGKLQVELAQLSHLSTRLIRGWTHLERQKGGIGLRGPGETQLESDRRMVRDRITMLKSRLKKVSSQRDQSRQPRMKQDKPIVSLVGYTNAGKSSLFNCVTESDVMVQDMLFATLDPTYREWMIPELGPTMLVDTVGFIRHLPHDLVEAFNSTLEESVYANLLLHVVDVSHEDHVSMIEAVEGVLEEIGADHIPCLQVYNKIDVLDVPETIDRDESGKPVRVWISVHQKRGLALLQQAILECLGHDQLRGCLTLPYHLGGLRSTLYEIEAVVSESISDLGEYELTISVPKARLMSLFSQHKVDVTRCWVVEQ